MNTHRAILAAPSTHVNDPLAALARKNGFAVTNRGADTQISAPLGRVLLRNQGKTTAVEFDAPSPAELQMLKELYAERFRKLGLDEGIRWDAPAAPAPLNQTRTQVVDCRKISPNFARLRLNGDFSAFARPGAGLHFRFLLGPDGAGLPYLDADGLTAWPGGIRAWHRPPYTVRWISETADMIDIDIVLHEGGRVTDWCLQLNPGDLVALNGPSGSKQPPARWLALFGDETALPVIARILEDAAPDTEGHAVIAVRDPADAQQIRTQTIIQTEWIDMADPEAMVARIQDLALPGTDRHAFYGGERAQAERIRALFQDKGLVASEAKSASYWTRGSTAN
ncbi:MAG: siderophore-interacting protein [Pseudomonadota bacterium]